MRAEDADQALASQERKGLHLQNKNSPWEAGIGDEVTGSQCSDDSLLCRGGAIVDATEWGHVLWSDSSCSASRL